MTRIRTKYLRNLVVGVGLVAPFFVFTGTVAAKTLPAQSTAVSPARGIDQPSNRRFGRKPGVRIGGGKFRTIDGTKNNRREPEMGATLTQLKRLVASDYADSLSALAGENRKSPREISNILGKQLGSHGNSLNASDFLWQWGQFLDHDLVLTDGVDPPEPEQIEVPEDDLYFDPDVPIPFNRSIYDPTTGSTNPRQQLNEVTSWIDASMVYGSDSARAQALRTLDGTGRLRTSDGNLLPFNFDGFPNAGGSSPGLFFGGDVRVNEQTGLTAMHTLFVREHNRLAAKLANKHRNWSGDRIYNSTRRLIAAQIQSITYNEFLPALLGPTALSQYIKYRKKVDARISNVFSTAAFRFGHSAVSSTLLRLDADGNTSPYGNLPLREAFFAPDRIINEGGIEPILRGLARQQCQSIDTEVVDDVRNFLFGPPGAGGFDLVALNIQRGRDHGLPGYNDTREQLGLARANDFSDITSNSELRSKLAEAYDSVDDMDVWVGGLSEDRLPQSHVGELFFVILKYQFEALRDGDRFWYTRVLDKKTTTKIENTRLSDIIRRNTDIGDELQNAVFKVDVNN